MYEDHQILVDAWVEAAAKGLTREQVLRFFGTALEALWKRACATLSDVTVEAILDRVLHHSTERHPVLSAVKIREGVLQLDHAQALASQASAAELTEAFRYLVVEFLALMGSLTAEVLTPKLYAELSKVTAASGRASGSEPNGLHLASIQGKKDGS